ncbi:MAG: replicative DNA helicase [Bacteroidota bacterium]
MADKDKNKPNKRSSNLRPQKNDGELSNYVFGKVQPQALPLEEAVLGALMLDKDSIAIVIDILRSESFYSDAHQSIYKAILRLFERSQPVDLLTVTEELKKMGELEVAGGPYYLVGLTNRVASAANIEYHARLIAQKHIQRELIRVSTKIIRDAYEDTTDVFQLLDDAEQGLFDITQQNLSRSYESMGTLAGKALKALEELSKREAGLTGVPTGFTDLDRMTSGWQPSDLIIMAARPGMGKCLGKGTKVVMFDGSLRKVEDIVVGDLLMGDDSTPRKVLSLARGREEMYWVRQNKGIDYRVNKSHILSLKRSRNEGPHQQGDILNINVKEYSEKTTKFKSNYKGYKVAIEFPEKEVALPPYFVGLWLGDGTTSKMEITNKDVEVVQYLQGYADSLGLNLKQYEKSPKKCPRYGISGGHTGKKGYSLKVELRNIGVLDNKHIPKDYLVNSTKNRLALLAGLIDSDGHYLVQSNGLEIAQKNQRLAEDIKFLCDSLGFRTSLTAKKADIAKIGYETTVHRLRIYGDIDQIPIRVKRKQPNPWKSTVDWRVTGIQVEYDKVDDYYGFEIDGNHLFLLEDMTVTHNTSLTLALAKNAAMDFGKGVAFFSLEMSNVQLVNRLISLEAEISGSKLRSGQLEDYEWQQLQAVIEKMSEIPIFIDDTPGINIFELRAKCRRLKMQHDIQMVIIDYLQLMTGGSDNKNGNREQEVSAISRGLKGLAKELNVPVIALSQLSRAVETRGGMKRPQLSDLRESGCLTGDALLIDATTGRRITIKELAERSKQTVMRTLAVDEAYKVEAHPMVKAFYSGKKEVFELKTQSGRSIKASANHPFLKLSGWTPLGDLAVGDKIAVPRNLKIERPDNPLGDNELILIAHLIGDGCILPRQPYHYTSADYTNIEIVNQTATDLFGITPRIVKQENWWHTYLKSPYHLTHGKKHPITNWYDKLGIDRARAFKKQIPLGVFRCDQRKIALFLNHLWATDGNVSWKTMEGRQNSCAVYYSSTSQLLAQQVQHLLLRLNILSVLRKVKQGRYKPAYQVHIQGTTQLLAFLEKVGCYGERGKQIPAMIDALRQINRNPNTDVIPQEAWSQIVQPLMQQENISQQQFADTLGIAKSSSTYKTGISRRRIRTISSVFEDSEQLANLSNSDVLWDTIKSITPLGIQDVYDATVEKVHNFVANDIIVHNSIEQDADIVSFIYRPEYYQILEDEEGQSLKGIGEVIIAKHRNGALGTVKLKFIDKYAKFAELDDMGFGDLPVDTNNNANTPDQNIISLPSRMNDEDIPF